MENKVIESKSIISDWILPIFLIILLLVNVFFIQEIATYYLILSIFFCYIAQLYIRKYKETNEKKFMITGLLHMTTATINVGIFIIKSMYI